MAELCLLRVWCGELWWSSKTDSQRGAVIDGDPMAIVARLHGTLLNGLLGTTVLGRIKDEPMEDWADQLVNAALDGLFPPPVSSVARVSR